MKINDAFKDWGDWLDVDKSPRTSHDYKSIVEHWIKDACIRNLDTVTPITLSNWINKKGKGTLSRRRLVLSVIKSFFNYCHATGLCKINPASIVKVKTDNLTHKQKEPKIVEAFNSEEVSELVSHIDEQIRQLSLLRREDLKVGSQYRGERKYSRQKYWKQREVDLPFYKAAVLLSYETGLRLSDICQLEWDCISDSHLTVHTDKRDKRVSIPLWHEVKWAINAIPEKRDELYCFPEHREMYLDPKKRARISSAFTSLLKKAGLSRKGLSFHSLRHGCLTRWRSGGLDLEHIQKLAGHSNPETTEGYIHQ
jgi:integrase